MANKKTPRPTLPVDNQSNSDGAGQQKDLNGQPIQKKRKSSAIQNLDPNNPLFAKRKDQDETDALVQQMDELLPGVLPQPEQTEIEVSADEVSTDEDGNEVGPMTDEEVIAFLNVFENRSRAYVQDEISIRAAVSNEFYLAQPEGIFTPPLSPGRSNWVDSSVADAINWLLPPLLDVFCGTQYVVEFQARQPQQEKSAALTTAMCNYVFREENPGYKIARTWIHDALMSPGGIIKVYWEPDLTAKTTQYYGLTDLQFQLLKEAADAGEFAIIKHRMYANPDFEPLTTIQHGLAIAKATAIGQQPQLITPQVQQAGQAIQQGANPGQVLQQAAQVQIDPTEPAISVHLHDIVVHEAVDHKNNERGKVKIVNVPLEEFYIDPQARSLEEAHYAAHARRITISDLRAMGFDDDILEEVSNTAYDPEMTRTYLSRKELEGAYAWSYMNNQIDPSMRQVIIVESYVKLDYLQTGIAEWRKIIRCGNTILLNEPCDGNPFIMLVANPLPHLAFGVSVAEQAQNAQLNQTQLMRALVDNVNLGANAQMWAVDGDVNLDDLLDSRPGGIIRVKNAEAVGVLSSGSGDVSSVTTLLELIDTMKQERTGVQKLTQGSDADIINETATGYQAMTERAEQRIKLMAREFAENGFKPLFLRIQKLLAQYQNEMMQIRLNGQTIEADPMDAAHHYDAVVRVGLGTGDKSRELAYLNTILELQQLAIDQSTGMADLYNVHNTIEKLVHAMNFTNVDEFFKKPQSPMPQPPQPQVPPEVQAKIQIEQMQAQNDAQRQERQAQLDAMKIEAQAKSDDQQAMLAHQRELAKLQMLQKIELEKLYLQAAIQREAAALKAMVDPAAEAALFNETFQSTTDSMNAALTKINLHASGEYDNFLNQVISAPEPDASQQNNQDPYTGV
jgi:hypothetical protein